MKTVNFRSFPRWLAAAALVLTIALPVPARAQVVVVANGSPITEFDIQQRIRLNASGKKNTSRKEAINELIDDRIKISRAKNYGLVVSDAEVDARFRNMAARQGLTPEQFEQVLGRSGITGKALKDRLRADMTWDQLVRGLNPGDFIVSERETANAVKASGSTATTAYDYTLYPITLVLSRDSTEATVRTRRAEAERLRSRFQNCQQGLALARTLRDVAVREPIKRNSADLPPPLRDLLAKMQIGHLTQPEPTPQGLQMFALCNKVETKADSPAIREARSQIISQRFEAQSKKLLNELRKQALIDYK